MSKFYNVEMLTGEILSIDEALNALYEYQTEHEFSNAFILPAVDGKISDDITLSITYDVEYDDFTDIFGSVIFRNSWIDDYDKWFLVIARQVLTYR